jgi:UDP-glucose 4-epimerase
VDFVIHQAALPSVQRSIEDPAETDAVNVGGFVALLKAAHERRVRRVVAASSSSVYGDTPTLPKIEAMPVAPLSPYAMSKVAAEGYARVFARTFGLPTVSLRYFNVFGPRQDPTSAYAAVIPAFVDALLSGRRPRVYGTGEQSRDFTYIDNVVQANLAACTRGEGLGEAVNIAGGSQCTLLDLLAALGRATGTTPDPQFLPRRPGDVMHSYAEIGAARSLLGYHPSVGLDEGLARTVEHFKREFALRRAG